MNLINGAMNSEEIKRLLEKYYEGDTTSEEELLLKKFFNMNNVPPDLRSDQDIFRFYMQMAVIPEPSADFETNIISAIDSEDKELRGFKRRRLFVTLSGIAAAMLIIAGSYFFFTTRSEPRDTFSDPEVAYAETMKILFQVSARLNQGTKALGHLSALQDETQKTMATVSRSTAKIEDNIKPLDNVFEAIRKADSN
jgi:hypothetical protein